jgi:hypothetical protein
VKVKFLERVRSHTAVRYVGILSALTAAILASAIVASLTIDLGPQVRALGERAASRQLKREVRIGRLSIHVLRGRVVVEDFSIGGLKPADRPFFTAKRLSLGLDWSTAWTREITISSVEMTDWNMLVERWADGHNFPKFTSDSSGPRRFTTTLKYLRAWRGQFTYDDHESPWSVVAPNADLNITKAPDYRGAVVFHGGVVKIQDYLPMWVNMKAQFALDGPRVHLDRIEFNTDGAESVATGELDFSRWPEQSYRVKSRVHFPRMREIFFAKETWSLSGDGDFSGVFRLFKGGYDLSGTFASAEAGINAYRFPALYGTLQWKPNTFEVWNAGSRFYGGDARFTYSIKRVEGQDPKRSRLDAAYAGVDLAAFSDLQELQGLRFAGAATGHVLLEWPMGRFVDRRGEAQLTVTPPSGMKPMPASLEAADAEDAGHARHEWGPFAPLALPAHLPVAGELTCRFDGSQIEIGPSRFVTERTHVTFQGSTEWGDRSRIPFHVTSRDWQESDQVLAGILTDFGARTGPVAFGGRGSFGGVMTGPFRRPRVEGDFRGADLRAWDTNWGDGSAHVVVENNYVRISGGLVRLNGSEVHADGLFSLGYPRQDGGDEIDARFRVVRRELVGLRHAFQLDAYPVSGQLSGEFHLAGQYERPVGFGGMTIENGTAYGEPFQKATASLRFDGSGVRLDGVSIDKSGGSVTGAAFVGWDGTYSFNAGGRRIPVERLDSLRVAPAPLSGIAEFSAGGSGTFEVPRYDVRFRVNDLFIGEEGVGQVTGSLSLRGQDLTGDVDAASPRLALTGAGRITLGARPDADLTFRFHDSSLDPYVRLFEPRLSPFTTAVASGSIHVAGQLNDFDRLLVEANVDTVDLRLFDYALRNASPIRIALDRNRVTLQTLQLVGEDTRLNVSGSLDLHDQRIAVRAAGDANIGLLQGFFRDVRGSGRAELTASMDGLLTEPVFSGNARITNGRIRHLSLPNSLDGINGVIRFDARGLQLDDVTATMGGGAVQFGGRIAFDGYMPGELSVAVRGRDMRLRYPEGIRSSVDADLMLRGNFRAPTIGGAVTVKSAVWTRRIDAPGSILDLAARATPGGGVETPAPVVPLRFDLQIVAPSTLRIETNLVRLVANANLNLRGTYDRPVLFGRADVDRGEVNFEGRRYRVTRGSIDFTNPNRIEPFFDVEAETNVRVPGQTYRVTVSAAGTPDRFSPKLDSDPPLPPADVLALLLSDVQRTQDVEIRVLQNPNQAQEDILKARATQALASPISSEVGKVVEQTFGIDTFQLTPSLIDPYRQTSRLNPTARLTIGKRISDRAYLTYSRSLNSTFNDQIILLEYTASDRLYWLLSRNEDSQTYALEFRVRHAF